MASRQATIQLLERVLEHLRQEVDNESSDDIQTLAAPQNLENAGALLRHPSVIALGGASEAETLRHLLSDIVPALNGQGRSSRYYGFVTGGVLPIAQAADMIVSAYDQNVQVHLPDDTIATEVEDTALRMLIRLLNLDTRTARLPGEQVEKLLTNRPRDSYSSFDDFVSSQAKPLPLWPGRTFTTGATASNILGLACAREWCIRQELSKVEHTSGSVPKDVGDFGLCARHQVKSPVILSTRPHSSIAKAASIVGIGRKNVLGDSVGSEINVSRPDQPWLLDLSAVEHWVARLRGAGYPVIICVSAGEVNTGYFATEGFQDMLELRSLANRHDAWIHVDGAFGLFARVLPEEGEFHLLRQHSKGLELADSVATDGHKMLNVPYDCGVFFTKHADILTDVCKNEAPYLEAKASLQRASRNTTGSADAATPASQPLHTAAALPRPNILSPLNVGIENSRRFRALPVYAVLHNLGREGFQDIFVRQVRLARAIATYIRDSADYQLLPWADVPDRISRIHIVVLFRARAKKDVARLLAKKINETRKVYVTPTDWLENAPEALGAGTGAIRLAVSNWMVDVERDLAVVKEILDDVAKEVLS